MWGGGCRCALPTCVCAGGLGTNDSICVREKTHLGLPWDANPSMEADSL